MSKLIIDCLNLSLHNPRFKLVLSLQLQHWLCVQVKNGKCILRFYLEFWAADPRCQTRCLQFVYQRSPRSIKDFENYLNCFWVIIASSNIDQPYIIKTIPQHHGERYPSSYNASSFDFYKYPTCGTTIQKKSNAPLGNQTYMT